jgi:hypothetical protein
MNEPTLIFVRHGQIGTRHFQHGDELPPNMLPREIIDHWLDERWLAEAADRRSLYRLFHHFSGCSESEQLSNEERNNLYV